MAAMERTPDIPGDAARARRARSTFAGMQPGDFDVDRLVWDPEYREALRLWLRQAGEADAGRD